MAQMMNEGQKNMLEWLQTQPDAEEVKKMLPFLRMMCGELESADSLPAEIIEAFQKEQAASLELRAMALDIVSKSAAKDSGRSVTDQSLLTKMLLKKEDTGIVTLGTKDGIEKQGRAQISGRLTLIEYNILRSILSYQFDNEVEKGGGITVSASQLYNKMRRGKGSRKVNKSQQAEIHNYMLGLERRIQIWLNDPASAWLGINEERRKNMRILHFDYDEGVINGQRTEYYYTIYNVGLLHEIAYRAGQLERIPQEVLAIEEYNGEKWKNWTLSEKRIKLRTVLELFYYQLMRVQRGIVSNKKPYADIFAEVEGIKTRADVKRAKEDIAVILNYWQHIGLFASWREYGNSRGIEITIDGEGGADGLLPAENA